MATDYAYINPTILHWARMRAKMSIHALAEKLSISEDKLHAWESGKKPPTFKQAQIFAYKTHIPFGYLFLEKPPVEHLPLPDLRTIDGDVPDEPSPELRDMVQIVMRRQQWFREYLKDQGVINNPHIGRFTIDSPMVDIVGNLRDALQVSPHPERGTWEDYFRDLVHKIEDIGVLVMRQGDMGHFSRPLSVREFRGFAIFDQIAPVIFINQADAPSARLFTLIHELAHIWTGQSGISDAKPTTNNHAEALCNAVAAEFLVPRDEFLQRWQDATEVWTNNIPALVAHFHVSGWVIARRAQSLNKITLDQYQQYVDSLKEQHANRERTNTGPTYYLTKKGQLSEKFSKALVSEALSGRVLLRDAGQLLGMKPNNLRKFAKELGI